MADPIVRCPYCMLSDEHKPMLQRPGWHVCEQCGHTVIPEDKDFKCSCRNCLRIGRVA
jgi:hypothetical protein